MAEGRGKAQADTLRRRAPRPWRSVLLDGRRDQIEDARRPPSCARATSFWSRPATSIPSDGEVIEGVAYVNEAAITGESAPVLKEPGTDIRSSVTGGTQIISDRLMIRITAEPGKTFLDRMIALVEGAERQKTPNEIALNILLAGLTIIFLIVVVTLRPFSRSTPERSVSTTILIALLVTLIPTTIGALLSAIGIAGMDRLVQRNVLAMSGRAVEAAGDVDVLLLDKTGTITFGNRMAAEFIPVGGVSRRRARPRRRCARRWRTRRRRASRSWRWPSSWASAPTAAYLDGAEFIPFTAETRMSGIKLDGHAHDEGRGRCHQPRLATVVPADLEEAVATASPREGGTPLAVARGQATRSASIYLKDTVKPGMRERFDELRAMGIRTIMITGDNPLTARDDRR